jgi:hypothetical protein
MSGPSSIDSLRRLAPITDGEAGAVFGGAGREELLAAVTDLPFGRGALQRPSRRRRPFVLAIAAVAAAATATGAWAVLSGSPAQETTSVQCQINGNDAVVPSTSGDPARDCAVEYKRDFGAAAPPLTAYDNGLGGVTVLPRAQKPPAGFKTLPSGSQDVELIQLQDSLDDYINGLTSSCLKSNAATELAKSRLEQFGLVGWAVTVRNSGSASSPGTCFAGNLVDPATQTVTLIPTEGPIEPATAHSLADKLRPLTRSCESLSTAVAKVRADADELGLSESARAYELDAVKDNSRSCASIYETVGGTIFLTIRGPNG